VRALQLHGTLFQAKAERQIAGRPALGGDEDVADLGPATCSVSRAVGKCLDFRREDPGTSKVAFLAVRGHATKGRSTAPTNFLNPTTNLAACPLDISALKQKSGASRPQASEPWRKVEPAPKPTQIVSGTRLSQSDGIEVFKRARAWGERRSSNVAARTRSRRLSFAGWTTLDRHGNRIGTLD
jgi:hypothetical protein